MAACQFQETGLWSGRVTELETGKCLEFLPIDRFCLRVVRYKLSLRKDSRLYKCFGVKISNSHFSLCGERFIKARDFTLGNRCEINGSNQ